MASAIYPNSDHGLRLAGDPNRLVARLEEAARRPRTRRGEQGGYEGSPSQACALVLGQPVRYRP
jgi:hypothetical protein